MIKPPDLSVRVQTLATVEELAASPAQPEAQAILDPAHEQKARKLVGDSLVVITAETLLTHDQEIALGAAMSRAKARMIELLARCPGAVDSIIQLARRGARGGTALQRFVLCRRNEDLGARAAALNESISVLVRCNQPPRDVAALTQTLLDLKMKPRVLFAVSHEHQGDPELQEIQSAQGELEDARNTLAEANERLMHWAARPFEGRGVSQLDLRQEAALALTKSIDGVDFDKNHKFSTYAVPGMRSWLQQKVKDRHMLPLPSLDKAFEYKGRGRRFWPHPLADHREASAEEIAIQRERAEQLRSALKILAPREREVIKLRQGLYGEREHTLDEVAKIYGITRERIRQIEARAVRKLIEHKAKLPQDDG